MSRTQAGHARSTDSTCDSRVVGEGHPARGRGSELVAHEGHLAWSRNNELAAHKGHSARGCDGGMLAGQHLHTSECSPKGCSVFFLRQICFPISPLFYAARRSPHTLAYLSHRFVAHALERSFPVPIMTVEHVPNLSLPARFQPLPSSMDVQPPLFYGV